MKTFFQSSLLSSPGPEFDNLILMFVAIIAVSWPGAHHCVECGININVLIQDPGFTFNAMDIDNV